MNYLLKAYIENEIADNKNVKSPYENEEWSCGLQDEWADRYNRYDIKLRKVLAILNNEVDFLEISDDDLYEVEEVINDFREYSNLVSENFLDALTYGVELTRDEANWEYQGDL